MPDKMKTIVIIESHEQIIIRCSRRTVSEPDMPLAAAKDPQEKRKSPGRYWKAFALRSARALAPVSRRMRAIAYERKNHLS